MIEHPATQQLEQGMLGSGLGLVRVPGFVECQPDKSRASFPENEPHV